jgi:hypothetical protein
MDLDDLSEVLDRLASTDPATHADGESMVEIMRQLARIEAFATTTAAAFETSEQWASDGAHTAAAWLATRCRLPAGEARRLVRRGRALRHLPACAEAFGAGAINHAHVDALSAVRRPATEQALARDEALLVEQAETMRFEPFTCALAYWGQLADPDGAEEKEQDRRDRRDAFLAESYQGMWLGGMTLDPVSGAIVSDELSRLETEQFEADWATARAELGRDPTGADLARTPNQRRADALVEMATRSRTAPPDGRRPAPLFTVLVDLPTLQGRVCELAQGIAITPGALLPWLDRAHGERVVFGLEGRIEVSATARLFTGATRRAIEVRDRTCTHPYCDRPAAQCQADHILPYTADGPTIQENGRLLCPFHNRLRNQRPPP